LRFERKEKVEVAREVGIEVRVENMTEGRGEAEGTGQEGVETGKLYP